MRPQQVQPENGHPWEISVIRPAAQLRRCPISPSEPAQFQTRDQPEQRRPAEGLFAQFPASAPAEIAVQSAFRRRRFEQPQLSSTSRQEETLLCTGLWHREERPVSGGLPFVLKRAEIELKQLALRGIIHQKKTVCRIHSGNDDIMQTRFRSRL